MRLSRTSLVRSIRDHWLLTVAVLLVLVFLLLPEVGFYLIGTH